MVDLGGRAVLPGFVDSHTHIVFAGDRMDEMARRTRGETYEEIAKAGGGLLGQSRHPLPFQKLVEQSQKRLHQMRARGTTTVEIKTGYGLSHNWKTCSWMSSTRSGAAPEHSILRLRWHTSYLPTGVTTDKNTSTNSAPRSWNQQPSKSVCSFVTSL